MSAVRRTDGSGHHVQDRKAHKEDNAKFFVLLVIFVIFVAAAVGRLRLPSAVSGHCRVYFCSSGFLGSFK